MDMTLNQQRVLKVLERIKAQVERDDDDAQVYANELDSMLDALHFNDFFGTEAENDPRGDFRNGEWGMGHVEGVDA